jgi:glutathione S-transferase
LVSISLNFLLDCEGKFMLKLYQARLAVCAIKVRLVLAEKNLPWEPINLNLRKGEQHQPDYVKLNPNGVVPTLIHDDLVLIESSVIMQYLDEVYPDSPLQPNDPIARARMRLWMKRVDEYLHPGNATLTYAMVHASEMRSKSPQELEDYYKGIPNPVVRERQRAAIELGLDAPGAIQALQFYDKAFTDMENWLVGNDWLAGDKYSLADTAITSYMNRFRMLQLSPMWTKKRPAVTDWFDRVQARPNFTSAITDFVSDSDMEPYRGLEDWAWPTVQSLLEKS